MVKTITFFCDICNKEFQPQEYSFLTGQLVKIDEKLNKHPILFEGHYCGECTNLILGEITKMKNDKHKEK